MYDNDKEIATNNIAKKSYVHAGLILGEIRDANMVSTLNPPPLKFALGPVCVLYGMQITYYSFMYST